MSRDRKPAKHRRQVTVSCVAPISALVTVESDDGEEWTIADILRLNCEASITTLNENMADEDVAAMYKAAAAAKDLT